MIRKLSESEIASRASSRHQAEAIVVRNQMESTRKVDVQALLLNGIANLLGANDGATASVAEGTTGGTRGLQQNGGQRRQSNASQATHSTQSSVWLPDMSGSWVHRPISPMGGSGTNRVPVSLMAATASGVTPAIPGRFRRPGGQLHEGSSLIEAYETVMLRTMPSNASLEETQSGPPSRTLSRSSRRLPPVSPVKKKGVPSALSSPVRRRPKQQQQGSKRRTKNADSNGKQTNVLCLERYYHDCIYLVYLQ